MDGIISSNPLHVALGKVWNSGRKEGREGGEKIRCSVLGGNQGIKPQTSLDLVLGENQ